jgi:hypothetical protein
MKFYPKKIAPALDAFFMQKTWPKRADPKSVCNPFFDHGLSRCLKSSECCLKSSGKIVWSGLFFRCGGRKMERAWVNEFTEKSRGSNPILCGTLQKKDVALLRMMCKFFPGQKTEASRARKCCLRVLKEVIKKFNAEHQKCWIKNRVSVFLPGPKTEASRARECPQHGLNFFPKRIG